MVTTSNARHSPEIAYLNNGVNGFMTADHIKEYADVVLRLVNDSTYLSAIKAAALADAERYTLEKMVEHFANGLKQCLEMPGFSRNSL